MTRYWHNDISSNDILMAVWDRTRERPCHSGCLYGLVQVSPRLLDKRMLLVLWPWSEFPPRRRRLPRCREESVLNVYILNQYLEPWTPSQWHSPGVIEIFSLTASPREITSFCAAFRRALCLLGASLCRSLMLMTRWMPPFSPISLVSLLYLPFLKCVNGLNSRWLKCKAFRMHYIKCLCYSDKCYLLIMLSFVLLKRVEQGSTKWIIKY